MTINFDSVLYEDSLKYLEPDLKPQFEGKRYLNEDGEIISFGTQTNPFKTSKEEGVFWNGRLVIPSTMMPKERKIEKSAIHCLTDLKGIRREGEFHQNKLKLGSIIHPSGQIISGRFDESERLIEGEMIQNQFHVRYTLKGIFAHGFIREKLVTRCQGTKTYAVSKYQETGLFENGVKLPSDSEEIIENGRIVKGRIIYQDYRLDGIFSYDGENTICEGVKTGFDKVYKATGVFINGVQKSGIIQYGNGNEEMIDDQETEVDSQEFELEPTFRLILNESM